ncbi:MAG TPA: Hsp20/alpha crystallin family protein [Nitrospira sp.]|jgi:HSP20 family protein|nr:Hsp20/alpha crystallin family protein [Nitrospira sp.]
MSTYLPAAFSTVRPDTFDGQIDRIFDEAVRAFGTSDGTWVPACNAWEDSNGFYLQMALPGWEPKDVALEVNNQMLSVKGAKTDTANGSRNHLLREIADGRFVRMFKLPPTVDHDKASANYKNGLLTIAFPKREEAKPRRIVIEG